MTRNLKALGLALVAVFAMSAVAASGASAQQGFLTADGPVTLDGTEVGEPQDNGLTSYGGATRCSHVTYTGHKLNSTPEPPTPKELIPSGSTQLTLTPHYVGCASQSGESSFPMTIEMTSCDYNLTLESTTESPEDTYGTDLDVVCENPGDAIHLTHFAGESHGFRVCSITIPAQADLVSHVDVTDQTNGHLLLKGTITGTDSSRSGLCGAASTTEGALHLNATVSGTNADQEPTAIALSE